MSAKQARNRQNYRKNCGVSAAVEKSNMKKRNKNQLNNRLQLQDGLLNPDFILKKVFRKDGPPLGVEFDSLPSHAFHLCHKDSRKSHRACQENQRVTKRRKVSNSMILENQCSDQGCGPVKKHGMGKGLMTVWRVTNPAGGDFPGGFDFGERNIYQKPLPISKKPPVQEKKKRICRQQPRMREVENKLKEKKKPPIRSRKAECQKIEKPKPQRKEKCELALEGGLCNKDLDRFSMLVDDEELELRELQAGPNPLTCCSHFSTNKLHSCSLCKDLLARFPPNSVSMKQLLYVQPWDSSPELVKKLFKVFHFLCTYAVTINICSFTFDEFAQAFLDKDSLLLGKVNVALLKLLLIDVETELSSGFLSHLSKNCKFLGLLQSVENQDFLLKLWMKSLNSLTWTEILRQVLVSAGFGSKHSTSPEKAQNKEFNVMSKYGLTPGTLKGELFSILSSQGNNGLKVSEMAVSSQIGELHLATTTAELEHMITSVLASDITLFEKISSSSYRLRITSVAEECEIDESDSEDFGSVDDDSDDSSKYDTSADSECDSGDTSPSKLKRKNCHKNRKNAFTVYNEIDESHPGEAWLLGLMEGEYSELNIEEKLDSLVALIDLLSAGSSIRMEDPAPSAAVFVPNNNHISSGGKIKRSTAKQCNLPRQIGVKNLKTIRSVPQPLDSSAYLSKGGRKKDSKETEAENDYLHPMQSIFLGSDRRYNRYWLFLGPCNAYDSGHKRIYFESSEDGHWEVIDTEEALCTLLSALDRRGTREAHLLSSLEKREPFLCRAMSSISTQSDQSGPSISREDSSSAVSDIDNNIYFTDLQTYLNTSKVFQSGKKEQQKQKWILAQEFDAWTWSSFYSDLNSVKNSKSSYLDTLARCESCHDLYWRDEKHCKICHITFELDFDLEEKYAVHASTCKESGDIDTYPKHKVLSSRLQSLKAASYAIESAMPEDALLGVWRKSAHNLWIKRLRRTSTLSEFLQVLADFVGAICEDWLNQCNVDVGSNTMSEDIIGSFSTMPRTSSAVALWLVKLDSLVGSHLERVHSQKIGKSKACS